MDVPDTYDLGWNPVSNSDGFGGDEDASTREQPSDPTQVVS